MKLYDIEEEHRCQRRDRALEIIASLTGLVGAVLLASRDASFSTWWGINTLSLHASWGWVAFLASNFTWITFAALRGLPWLLAMQVGFTCTSAWGIWNWIR